MQTSQSLEDISYMRVCDDDEVNLLLYRRQYSPQSVDLLVYDVR